MFPKRNRPITSCVLLFPTTLNYKGKEWKAEDSGNQIEITMSPWQLEKYVEVRDIERNKDRKGRVGSHAKHNQREIDNQVKNKIFNKMNFKNFINKFYFSIIAYVVYFL